MYTRVHIYCGLKVTSMSNCGIVWALRTVQNNDNMKTLQSPICAFYFWTLPCSLLALLVSMVDWLFCLFSQCHPHSGLISALSCSPASSFVTVRKIAYLAIISASHCISHDLTYLITMMPSDHMIPPIWSQWSYLLLFCKHILYTVIPACNMDYSVMFSDTGTNRHDDHLSNTVYFPFSPFLSSFHVVSASLCHKVLGLTAYGNENRRKGNVA